MFDSSKYYRIELLSSPEKEKTDINFPESTGKRLGLSLQKTLL